MGWRERWKNLRWLKEKREDVKIYTFKVEEGGGGLNSERKEASGWW